MRKRAIFFLVQILILQSLAFAGEVCYLESESATIFYEEGLQDAAREVVLLLPLIEKNIHNKLGLGVDFTYKVILYNTNRYFYKIAGNNHASAFAVPGKNIIAIDYAQMKAHPLRLKPALVHELCHLTLHNYVKRTIPKWLDEGISQWITGGADKLSDPNETAMLEQAALSGNFFPFGFIEKKFPSDRIHSILAYEQSRSIVDYIERKYGRKGLIDILIHLQNGSAIENAINDSLPITMAELENGWDKSLKPAPASFLHLSSQKELVLRTDR